MDFFSLRRLGLDNSYYTLSAAFALISWKLDVISSAIWMEYKKVMKPPSPM